MDVHWITTAHGYAGVRPANAQADELIELTKGEGCWRTAGTRHVFGTGRRPRESSPLWVTFHYFTRGRRYYRGLPRRSWSHTSEGPPSCCPSTLLLRGRARNFSFCTA